MSAHHLLFLSKARILTKGDESRVDILRDAGTEELAVGECDLSTSDDLQRFILNAEERESVNLFQFTVYLRNYNSSPYRNNTGFYYKPWLWYTTKNQHGRTLLMLSFHYDVLSMNILTIGVKKADIELRDNPFGCFVNLSTDMQANSIRMLLLSQSVVDKSPSSERFVCNQEIQQIAGRADFVHNCCRRDIHNNVVCSRNQEDFWINILYLAITSIKILMFLFCPKFLPKTVYNAAYVASEYVVHLKNSIQMKIFITDQADTNVRYRKRLTFEQISAWAKFREAVDNLPREETSHVHISQLRIKVKGKRILPECEPPTGLLRTVYDNLFRCKLKNLDPFKDCCESSIFADMEPNCRLKITWFNFIQVQYCSGTIFFRYNLVLGQFFLVQLGSGTILFRFNFIQVIVKMLMIVIFPIPYYIRLIIYFKFEEDELTQRRRALEANGLYESFNLYRASVVQYLTPTHGLFLATYALYVLVAVIIGFSDRTFREKLKDICRCSLQDMNAVSQTGVLGIGVRAILYPFKRCGIMGFLLAPVYLVVLVPVSICVFLLYCLPTVYLSFRIPYHARKLARESALVADKEKNQMLVKMQMLGKKLSRIDKSVHSDKLTSTGENVCCPDEWSCAGCASVRSVLLQVLTSIFTLCILYSIALVFSESIGLFVEVMAFTMMGIIINAGNVLKYVSMVLLVFVYMNDCYSNVYENYLTFNKTIIDDIIERTTSDLRRIASMSSSEQENTAFQVTCLDETKEKIPKLDFSNKEIRWKIGQLLLFLDCNDTPRIPLRLFQRLCEVQVYGAPGPVYLSLLMATGKFMIIVVFLMFVMIVVMAFGNVYAMSSTNTTLATLAGGFVPMLLKNVLSTRGARLSLKTVSFKGQMDEIIDEFTQSWPVLDLIVERFTPEEKGTEGEMKIEKEITEKEEKNEILGQVRGPGDVIMASGNEENVVDLFIDLSVADTAGWSIYGSVEELSSGSEIFMPPYFEPDVSTEPQHQPRPQVTQLAVVTPVIVMYSHDDDH
ncbi:uncharacterized protein LOC131951625 isoform X2 [Physella acuta]|uniref:uncharacterized protein LOC131951625 isoform X2 n=1 Tax=Physella acuta TaxID=109671 RepID=UPI0027DCCF6F|nr:uncharacterized protein LOC131951625 isoform X2 [Physella acuta]